MQYCMDKRICNSREYTSGLSARFKTDFSQNKRKVDAELQTARETGIYSCLFTVTLTPNFVQIS